MTSGGRAKGLGVARGMLCLWLAQCGAGAGLGSGPGPTSRESCAPCSESFLLLRPREVECLVLLGGEFCPHCEGLLSLGVC